MTKRIAFFIVFFSFFLVARGYSQTVYKLTLHDAIQMALKQSYEKQISQLEFNKSQEFVRDQLSALYPKISLSGAYQRTIMPSYMPLAIKYTSTGIIPSTDGTFVLLPNSIDNNIVGNLSASFLIFQWSIFSGSRALPAYKTLSEQILQNSLSKIVTNVTKGYYATLIAKSQYELTAQGLERSNNGLNDARKMFQQKIANDIDTLRASVAMQNIEPLLIKVKNIAQITHTNLKVLLGLNSKDSVVIIDSLSYTPHPIDQLTFDEAYKECFGNRTELQMLRSQIELNKLNIDVAIGTYLPTINLFGNIQSAAPFNDTKNPSLNFSAFAGVQVSIPIFNGFKELAQIETARLTYQQSIVQLTQAEEYVYSDIKNKLSQMKESLHRIKSQLATMKSSERIYDVMRTRWKNGLATQLELFDADLSLTQSKTNYSQAIFDYLNAKVDLEFTLGRLNTFK